MISLEGVNLDQWHLVLDALPNPITLNKKVLNEDGNTSDQITFVNKAFINSIGYTIEDIPTDIVWFNKAYPSEEYQKYIINEWSKLVEEASKENKNLLGLPAEITCKDNVQRWFQVTTNIDYPIADEYHLIVFVEIKTPDNIILELQKTTQELIYSKESLQNQHMLLQKIIDLVPVAMFWKDMDGVFLGANKRFVEDAQLNDVSQIIGKTDFDMTWKRDAQKYIDDDAAIVKSGVPRLLYEEEQPKEDGSCIYLVTSKVPLKDINDKTVGILGVYNDITEHKKLQKEAKERDAQLLQKSRMAQMGEMISMIAHQWRQPLGAISASVIDIKMKIELESLKLEDSDEKYVLNQMNHIDLYTQNLSTTIDDFRNFYKPNKKLATIKLEEICIKSLAIVKTSIINSNIDVIEEYSSNKTLELYTNEMIQVILNILKNAQDNFLEKDIKEPYIKITTNDNVLSICDNGGGIPNNIIDKIFNPYFSTRDDKNGTGLGLYMSKLIVEEHHNATLDAVNTVDGVCFKIEFV